MNHSQSYMDVHQPHLQGGQSHVSQPSNSGALTHYQYQPPAPYQPPSNGYATGPAPYTSQYGYHGHNVPSPQHVGQMNTHLPHSQSMPSLPSLNSAPQHNSGTNYSQSFDQTGQVAPAGMKPRVTATLWEDEGSLCFQVEAKGICVARREDNHMINGTKLLNVAGMTRGRRDGILKSEKHRHVVKIGPMHLKGVWIPFERALEFANKEKITELLYPLFVHNIGALLYHPANQQRTHSVMVAAERRRLGMETGMQSSQPSQQPPPQMRPQTSQAPALTHHHSMGGPVTPHLAAPSHSIAPHPTGARPELGRANTFPTPPTSASSVLGMANPGNSYDWSGSNMSNVPNGQQMPMDNSLNNARSMPATPATTPPGNTLQNMPQQYQAGSGYDSSRAMYTLPPTQQSQYTPQQSLPPQNMPRYSTTGYLKNDMGPPARTSVPGESEHQSDSRVHDGLLSHNPPTSVGHGAGEEEAEHEHDSDYTHDANNGYRASYSYSSTHGTTAYQTDANPELTESPNAHGRATPRTSTTSQQQWAPGYNTPPRPQQPPSSNLYNLVSDVRGSGTNGNAGGEGYSSAPGLGTTLQTGYASQPHQSSMNGTVSSNKRVRELDDDEQDHLSRPSSRGANGEIEYDGLKRRRTIREGSVGQGSVFDRDARGGLNRTKSAIVQRRR